MASGTGILFCVILTLSLPLTIFANGVGYECDVSQGEVFLAFVQVSNYAECKKSCEDEAECRGVTFYGTVNDPGGCTHFSTECKNTRVSEDGDTIAATVTKECDAPTTDGIDGTISLGEEFTMLIKDDDSLWVSGRNDYGQLGLPAKSNYKKVQSKVHTKTFVKIDSNVKQVSAGFRHATFMKKDGSVWTTGWNYYGELGDGTKTTRYGFVEVIKSDAQPAVKSVTAGRFCTFVIKEDDSLWGAGSNKQGTLGDGTGKNQLNFVKVMDSGVQLVSPGGAEQTFVLKKDGSLWATGASLYGFLGDGTVKTHKKSFFELFSGGIQHVNAGYGSTMVLKDDGTLWGWGWNYYGELGDGRYQVKGRQVHLFNAPKPIQLYMNGKKDQFFTNVKIMTTSKYTCYVILNDGTLYAAGWNRDGQLGIKGSSSDQHSFIKITENVKEVMQGMTPQRHLIRKQDGTLWAAGRNSFGQMGDGTNAGKRGYTEITMKFS